MSPPFLDVQALTVRFKTREGVVQALDQVSFSVNEGDTLAVVGESGSGKSVSAFAIMGILDSSAEIEASCISLAGIDLTSGDRRAFKQVRGREVAMIFQNPRTALNPIRPIGAQLIDVFKRHGGLSKKLAREAAIDALTQVRIPDAARRFSAYPFQLSGGMCQRVMIALALASKPRLLIADEPTTGLDVTTQAAIMDLLQELATSRGMATVLITHDLGLARDYASRVAVMHAGHVVETGCTEQLFRSAAHPYTRGLMAATPTEVSSLSDLQPIAGGLPDLRSALPPCRYSARCASRTEVCIDQPLPLIQRATGHSVSCHHPIKVNVANLQSQHNQEWSSA